MILSDNWFSISPVLFEIRLSIVIFKQAFVFSLFFLTINIFFLLAGHKVYFMSLKWENITGMVPSCQSITKFVNTGVLLEWF